MRLPLLILALLPALVPRQATAAESYDNCTGFINSLPATISTQGTWCMNKDLATGISSGAAITIAANNVTLDCNHFKLGGLSAGTGTMTTGILSDNRVNNVVRRCNVRGFRRGTSFTGASSNGHSIEDNRFESNIESAIWLVGDDLQVRRNFIIGTGLAPSFINTYAIYVGGEADVIDNTVDGVYNSTSEPQANLYGIMVNSPGYSMIQGNRVRNLDGGTAWAIGITAVGTGHTTLVRNRVAGGTGLAAFAIRCINGQSTALDNTMVDFPTGLDGCSNDGGNVNTP